jgi:hypothetical protein
MMNTTKLREVFLSSRKGRLVVLETTRCRDSGCRRMPWRHQSDRTSPPGGLLLSCPSSCYCHGKRPTQLSPSLRLPVSWSLGLLSLVSGVWSLVSCLWCLVSCLSLSSSGRRPPLRKEWKARAPAITPETSILHNSQTWGPYLK